MAKNKATINSSKAKKTAKEQIVNFKKFASDFIDELTVIRRNSRDIPKANYELAMNLYKMGESWNALKRFKFVNKIAPNRFPLTYYYMGRIELEGYQTLSKLIPRLIKRIIFTDTELGRPIDLKTAKEYFERSLQNNPEHEETKYFVKILTDPQSTVPLTEGAKFTFEIPDVTQDSIFRLKMVLGTENVLHNG